MSSIEPETRDRILAETLRLMVERRGEGVRVSDIARAAGISRQALYLHFASRAELLVATVRYADQTRGLAERLRPYRSAPSGVAALDAYVEFWGNYIPEVHGLAKALLAVRHSDEAAAAAWEDRMAAVRTGCHRVIERLAGEGNLAPGWEVDRATEMMWALLSVATWENLTIDCAWPVSQYVHWMQLALRKTFVKDPDPTV